MALSACGGDSSGGADTIADSRSGADTTTPPRDTLDTTDAVQTPDGGDTNARDAADTTATPPTAGGYPAEGLLIRVTTPDGDGTADADGIIAQVGGVLFGDADTIIWQLGEQTGVVEPARVWGSGPIQLSPGDNRISVTASAGSTVATDAITITYNPVFRFDDTLRARPRTLWVDTPTEVVFTIPTSSYQKADRDTVTLLRVDASGALLEELGPMVDDGTLNASGDEIEGDAVFTFRKAVTCTSEASRYYRASVEVDASPRYTAVSPTIRIECLKRVPTSACEAHMRLIDAATLSVEAGTPVDVIVATLAADPSVKAAGRAEGGGTSAWVQFHDGILGAVLGTPAGLRGGGGDGAPGYASFALQGGAGALDVGSKRAIVLAPFASEFLTTEDAIAVANAVATSECPSFDLETGAVLQGEHASLARFRSLSSFGVASVSTHGEVLFGEVSAADMRDRYRWRHSGPQEVVWTGSAVACGKLLEDQPSCTISSAGTGGGCPAGTRCLVTAGTATDTTASGEGICVDETQADLRAGRAILTNRGYAVTPAFFDAYRGVGYPRSLVNLGACRTMYNGSLASTLYAAGARAITGFSGYVESDWARDRVVELFGHVGESGFIGDWFVEAESPTQPGSMWRLFGASNLHLSNAEIINADFEAGTTVGWSADGDGRVVAKLGETGPVDGKFMGLVSTGLGFTLNTGKLEQTFCIPDDKRQLELYWRFFSEEFKEFCGSVHQDAFEVVLVGAGGQQTVVNATVNDLCGYGDGTCASCPNPLPCDPACAGLDGCYFDDELEACGGEYNCQCGRDFIGLVPSDVGFDQGGVYRVDWKRTVVNIEALAGRGPVTMSIFARDTGDSLFDTAILIDAITFD